MLTLILLLAAAGILLAFLEMFLPGGVLGVLSALLLLAVVILCYQEYGAQTGGIVLTGLAALGLALFLAWMRFFPSSPAGKLLMLKGRVSGRSVPEAAAVPPGAAGVAVTALRPAGAVRINGKRYDARMDTGFADPGDPVRVLRADGAALVVEISPKESDSPKES